MRPHRQQPTRLPQLAWESPGKNTGVGCHFLLQCMKVKSQSEVAQSCLTLSDPIDCSLPGSSTHGIFQARVWDWGAIAFSEGVIGKILFLVLSLPSSFFICFKCEFKWNGEAILLPLGDQNEKKKKKDDRIMKEMWVLMLLDSRALSAPLDLLLWKKNKPLCG